MEVCLTVLHAGGKFGGGGYKVSGGLHGVGASVVNALSSWLKVDRLPGTATSTSRNMHRGKIDLRSSQVVGDTDKTGTYIRFKPDVKSEDNPDGMFETGDFEYDVLKQRLREMAFLNTGIRIRFIDERGSGHDARTFYYEGGIQRVRQVSSTRTRRRSIRSRSTSKARAATRAVEVAMQYNDSYSENIFSFCQQHSHRRTAARISSASSTALTRVINDYGRQASTSSRSDDERSTGEDVREGLAAIISVKLVGAAVRGPDQDEAGQQRSARAWSTVSWPSSSPPILRRTRRSPAPILDNAA